MSTPLTDVTVKNSYPDILQVGNAGSGLSTNLLQVCDGDATPTPLILSPGSWGSWIAGGLYATALPTISGISWNNWYKADSLPVVADGTAISSWPDSGSNAYTATQATGANKPLYKIGANGINGLPVVRFGAASATTWLATTTGGAGLNSDWYIGIVLKINGGTAEQELFSWGDAAGNGKERKIYYYQPGPTVAFSGQNADANFTQTLTPGTPYLVEFFYNHTTNKIGCYINGVQNGSLTTPSGTINSYASAIMTLGANQSNANPLNADVAEIMALGSLPSASQQQSIWQYVSQRYNIVYPYGIQFTGNTGAAFNVPAAYSLNGSTVLYCVAGEHVLVNNQAGYNVAAVWNPNPTGLSAFRYCYPNSIGQEFGANGVAYAGATPFGGTHGSWFIEASNFKDDNIYGNFRLLQTKSVSGVASAAKLRMEVDESNNINVYDVSGSAFAVGALIYQCTAAGVWTGQSTNGWFQNTPGEGALAAAFTDATGTLAATNLSYTLKAGRTYRIEGYLIVSNSLAADGAQFNFNGGGATATAMDVVFTLLNGSVVAGTVTSTSLAGVLNYTTVTGTNRIQISGYIKCNAAGTFIFQAATNTHVSGTMTLAAGSWIALYDTVAK